MQKYHKHKEKNSITSNQDYKNLMNKDDCSDKHSRSYKSRHKSSKPSIDEKKKSKDGESSKRKEHRKKSSKHKSRKR